MKMACKAFLSFSMLICTMAGLVAQTAGYATDAVVAGEGVRLKQVSTGNVIHHFFDTSPLSSSGKYLALFRMPDENTSTDTPLLTTVQWSPVKGEAGLRSVITMR